MRERPALAIYTAVTIVAGIAALAWAAVTFPIDETISLTTAGGREGILLGLVFWIAIGLLGGTRVERMHGHGVLTFHIPFIVAAMALGGPTAGALVAMLSTIERRELREVPWYGTLANHAALTFSAVVGGVVLLAIDGVARRPAARQAAGGRAHRHRRRRRAHVADRHRHRRRHGAPPRRPAPGRRWPGCTTRPSAPPPRPRSSSAGCSPSPTANSAGGRR